MKNYRNQLDRFRDIAKKLVDEHSAELFTGNEFATDGVRNLFNDAYYMHLDVLGRQLDEQAQLFITTNHTRDEGLKSDVWSTCKKYIEQFAKRNQPSD